MGAKVVAAPQVLPRLVDLEYNAAPLEARSHTRIQCPAVETASSGFPPVNVASLLTVTGELHCPTDGCIASTPTAPASTPRQILLMPCFLFNGMGYYVASKPHSLNTFLN